MIFMDPFQLEILHDVMTELLLLEFLPNTLVLVLLWTRYAAHTAVI